MSRKPRFHRSSHPHSQEPAEAAKDRLKRMPYWTIRRLTCDCRDGVLVLRGELPSFYYKQLAQAAVKGIAGVTQVVNEIQVIA